jgi:protocatechuate 3,4-dioxygenase beta subunit
MCGSRLIRRIIPLALVALVWAGLHAPAHAQATRGTVLGTVTDQSGAAMPGVTVTITETRTNVSRDTVTNETGNYTFPNTLDGIYDVKAELQGFKTVLRGRTANGKGWPGTGPS